MSHDLPSRAGARRLPIDRILQGMLALVGFGTFALLVRNLDIEKLATSPGRSFPLLVAMVLGLATINYLCDTLAWWLVFDAPRPSFLRLVSIRLRCEALTNVLPGGAIIGEPMKIAMLRSSCGMGRVEATTSYLLSRFTMIVAQVFYVISGVAISYDAINRASVKAFGITYFTTAVLWAAFGILILLTSLLAALIWFKPLVRWLYPSQGDGPWHRRWNVIVAELHSIEDLIARSARKNGMALLGAFLLGFVAWALNGVELYIILRWLGLASGLGDGYALDAVSSIVRMVLFVLPIGIGAQDWTITGLMVAFGFADPVATSARIVALKRGREFAVIAIGLVMLLVMRRAPAPERGAEPDRSGDEFSLAGERHLSARPKEV